MIIDQVLKLYTHTHTQEKEIIQTRINEITNQKVKNEK